MSHPNPSYDPDNSYEDDMNYDDYNDFHDDDAGDFDMSCYDEPSAEEYYDDSMDGDAESAFGSCGWGVDEYYNADTDYGDDF